MCTIKSNSHARFSTHTKSCMFLVDRRYVFIINQKRYMFIVDRSFARIGVHHTVHDTPPPFPNIIIINLIVVPSVLNGDRTESCDYHHHSYVYCLSNNIGEGEIAKNYPLILTRHSTGIE